MRCILLATLLLPEGRPLFYWGARAPVVSLEAPAEQDAAAPRLLELHAARDGGDLVLRFSYDRAVRDALRPAGSGAGQLQAVVYVDRDDQRASGAQFGGSDLRSGAELRLELGVLAIGEDPEEKRAARALIAATLHGLTSDGRRRVVWRADGDEPRRVSAHDDAVELRVPGQHFGSGSCRFVVVTETSARDGRLPALR